MGPYGTYEMSPCPPPLWKASVTLPKDRAADAAAVFELTPAPAVQAVLTAEDPFAPDATVEALYETKPDVALLSRLIGHRVTATTLPDQDWIRASQEGLPPVRAGRFFVYGAHDAGKVPNDVIPIRIEAGLAFGTGHHETTALCLTALSELRPSGLALGKVALAPQDDENEHDPTHRPRHAEVRGLATQGRAPKHKVLDLGCGSGVLAIAAAKLWGKPVLAVDIDPDAVAVTNENARDNDAALLVQAVVADGLEHPAIHAAAPFDLILGNILAGPLSNLASAIAAALAPGGVAVLSGLLRWQEEMVLRPYRAQGLMLKRTLHDGPWSALVLERPRRRR